MHIANPNHFRAVYKIGIVKSIPFGILSTACVLFPTVTIIGRVSRRLNHDDVIKWKHFPRYWPFVRGIHRSPVISPHKGQRRGAFMFSLICVWINGWVNNGETGGLRRHRPHNDVIVMIHRQLDCSFHKVIMHKAFSYHDAIIHWRCVEWC